MSASDTPGGTNQPKSSQARRRCETQLQETIKQEEEARHVFLRHQLEEEAKQAEESHRRLLSRNQEHQFDMAWKAHQRSVEDARKALALFEKKTEGKSDQETASD